MEGSRNASPDCFNVEDRISRLPDSLIHHIMSFFDTKYAVQTCVLSKRWKPVWESLPFLSFKRSTFSYENTKMFINFVDMVFIYRDESTVQKFSVVWGNSEPDNLVITNVNRWIHHVLKYDVQEISVWITDCGDTAYEIPHRLFNCKSLTKLRIRVVDDFRMLTAIILPRSMNLPQLKVLIFDGLFISDVESFKRLFSSCPVLDTLLIVDCDSCPVTDDKWNLSVDSPSLQKFKYTDCMLKDITGIIELCAPNLTDFSYKSSWNLDYSLENCSSPSRVSFEMFIYEEDENEDAYEELPLEKKDVYAKRMLKFLGAFCTVKELSLSTGVLEVLSQALDISDCQPPRLCNLERLTLDMWFTRGCFRSVAYLLNMSPNLASITLTLKESNVAEVRDDWDAGLSLPGKLSQLKSIQIKEVVGCDAELKLLSFFLKNAKVLEKLVLFPRYSADRVREEFQDKLTALPRASSRIRMHWPATKSTHRIMIE